MKIIILVLILVLLVGCKSYDTIKFIPSNSTGECSLNCKLMMEEKWCISSTASFSVVVNNDELLSTGCECGLYYCHKGG